MTSPGRYAASDGSFARSTGNAAARGGILIGIAVLIGLVLLWKGLDGGDDPVAADDGAGDVSDDADATDDQSDDAVADPTTDVSTDDVEDITSDGDITTDSTPTTEPAVVDNPADVVVAVLNGTTTGGLAGDRSTALSALGYQVTAPGNGANKPVADSGVYYTDGYADEAKVVAEALSGSSLVLSAAPADPSTLADPGDADKVATANIIVVLGDDGVLS